jgi:transposase-like protein
MNQAPVKVRRKFDETFKREALQNWHSSGKSATVIAQELGLKANRLYAWQQHFAQHAGRTPDPTRRRPA